MRNLKRVLSLALATVMLLGMMVIGAGAADAKAEAPKATAITDLDKVVNKKAVNLMVDLGIIVGKPDGTFDPTGAVDRATMAKLITYIMMGDVSADLFEGTTTDLKDIETSWAKGYIKYCYANKIIGGDGQGSFFPTKGVTAAEASKMLLVAIGYDAKAQGYEGNSWSINVMRDAKVAGLLEGIAVKTNDPLTRDTAAQMIFNALMSPTVKYETQYDGGIAYKANPTTKTSGLNNDTLGEIQYDLKVSLPALLSANEANTGASAKGESTIGGVKMPVITKIEDIGKNVVYFTFDKDGKNDVKSSTATVHKDVRVVTVPSNLVASGADADHKLTSTWLTESGLREITGSSTVTPKYTNYAKVSDIATGSLNADIQGGAITDSMTAYVIDNNNDGIIDALVVNSMTVKVLSGDVKTATSGTVTTVYVPNITTGYTNISNVTGYEGLKKNDVVFTMAVGANVTFITKAPSITGTITGYKASSAIYVDGTAYKISSLNKAMSYTDIQKLGTKDAATFWLDAAGKIAYAKGTVTSTASKLALMVGYSYTGANGVSDVAASAKLVLSDGTIEVVQVSTDSSYLPTISPITDANLPSQFKYVLYSVDTDGKYVLADASAAVGYNVSASIGDGYITTGKATLIMSTDNSTGGYVGNANTVFVVANWNTAKTKITGYTVTTGIANAPSYTGGGASVGADAYVVADAPNGLAKLVFITGGNQISSGSSTYLYTQKQDAAIFSAADKTYTIEAFVDGVKGQIVVSEKAYKGTLTANGLYKVDITNNVVTGATLVSMSAAQTGISYNAGTLGIGTSEVSATYSTTDEKTLVFLKDGSVLTAIPHADILTDTNDTVQAVVNSKGVAEVIIITKVANPVDTIAELGALFNCTDTKLTLTGAADAGAAITALSAEGTAAIDANWTAAVQDVKAVTFTNPFIGFQFKTAGATPYKITVKIVGTGAASYVATPATTITLANSGAAATATGTYKLAASTTGLEYTVTVSDGDTEWVQVYTQSFS